MCSVGINIPRTMGKTKDSNSDSEYTEEMDEKPYHQISNGTTDTKKVRESKDIQYNLTNDQFCTRISLMQQDQDP